MNWMNDGIANNFVMELINEKVTNMFTWVADSCEGSFTPQAKKDNGCWVAWGKQETGYSVHEDFNEIWGSVQHILIKHATAQSSGKILIY